MIQKLYNFIFQLTVISLFFTSCEDKTSEIGTSITQGEVSITIDSLTFDLGAKAVAVENFDSKTGTLLIGKIDVAEYGSLDCSFVTRLMCAPKLEVPDSLFNTERVDSCVLRMFAYRSEITGDTLAPQQLSVFRLNKQLPNDIDNLFDPSGYYDPQNPLGIKNYTLSNIAASDSAFLQDSYIEISVNLPQELGKDIFSRYKDDPSIFAWPQTFAQYFPGILVKSTFGNGNVANLVAMYMAVYYHKKVLETVINDEDTTTMLVNKVDSVVPFTTAPEVLSSNNIKYKVSDFITDKNDSGEIIVTTPGGYYTSFNFPADEIIAEYKDKTSHLATVNDLYLSIPAEEVANNNGLGLAPNLMLIKTSMIEEFFSQNKIPDNVSSFTSVYNSSTGYYDFSSMRAYILDLINKGSYTEEDINFTVIPVDITTESVSNSYYGTTSTYVVKCVPYTVKPTMTRLHTENALIVFSFSSQMIE